MNKLVARFFLRPSIVPRFTRMALPHRYFSAEEKITIKVDMQTGKLTQETAPAVSNEEPPKTPEGNPSYVCKRPELTFQLIART